MSSWPWFPFYVDDFLASPKVQKMDLDEIGAYVLLLCEQWQEGFVDPGNLPKSLRRSPKAVAKILNMCFEPTARGWVNLKLDELRQGQDAKSAKAKAAARARWHDANASPEHMRTHAPSNASQNQSQNQNHTPPSVESASEGGKKKRKAALPPDWRPNEGHHERAKASGLNVELEAEAFRDHHTAKGSVMLDWDAAFRTWLRNAVKFQARDSKRPSEDAAQALLARQAEGWTERRRATEEALAKKLSERTTSPPIANEPSGNLGGTLTRVLSAVQPGGNAA